MHTYLLDYWEKDLINTALFCVTVGRETKFMCQLISAKNESFFSVDNAPLFFVKSFLIRQAYKDLYRLTVQEPREKHFLVLGNPGIGKTIFLQYVLMRILKRGLSVLYQKKSQDTSIYFDIKKREATVHFGTLPDHISTLMLEGSIFVLIDAASKRAQTMQIGRCPSIIASFPNGANYKDVVKDMVVVKLYMPIWSLDEIKIASRAFENDSEINISDRFARFGGIPRIIFEKSDDRYSTYCFMQTQAIESCEVSVLNLKGTSIDLGSTSHHVHHVYHEIVTGDKYERFTLQFASDYVDKHLLAYLAENHLTSLIKQVHVTTTELKEHLFHAVSHQQLASGDKFHCRALRKNLTDTFCALSLSDNTISPVHLLEGQGYKLVVRFTDLNQVELNGDYFVADDPDLHLSALVAPQTLFVITMKEKFGLQRQSLVDVLEILADRPSPLESVNLYFVVPKDNFPSFDYELTTRENKTLNRFYVNDKCSIVNYYVVTHI